MKEQRFQSIARLFHNFRTKQILVRMMAGYVSVLLVILLFNVCIYFYLKPILIQEKVDNTKNYLSYISQQTDVQLFDVKKNMHKFLEESDVLRNGGYSENVIRQMQLTKDLIYMMATCPMIENAAIYDPDSTIVVTNEGTCSKEALVRKIQECSTLLPEEIRVCIDTNRHFDYFPVRAGEKPTPVFYTGISYSSAKNYKMIVFADGPQIQDMLTNSMVEEYAQTYIVNQEFDTILSIDESQFDKNLVDKKLRYNGHTMLVCESEFQDWTYISVLNDQRIVQNLGFMKNTFLLLLSLMFIICAAICIRFVKQYYTPISNIIDNYMLTLHSGKTEFEAISETIDFLREKEQQSEEKEILSGILHSGFYEKNIDSLFAYASFRVAVARGETKRIDEADVEEIFRTEEELICKVIYDQHNGCTLILNGNDLNYHRVFSVLFRLQRLFREKYDVFIAFGVSDICEQLMDLHEAYRAATKAIDYGDSSQEACIYIKQDLAETNQRLYMPIDFEQSMTECVYVRNYDGIRTLIEDVFRQNKGVPNVYLHSAVMSMCNAYENICKKLENTPVLSEEIVNHEYRVPVIEEHLIAAFTGLEGDMVKENRVDAVRNYVTMYIAENYSDPTISIEMIAEDIQLSASYVSTLFKKATGIAFSQYLLQYRIDAAKELLHNSREKISVISEKAGFGTYNNFVRMFKKKTGVSPSQYRMINQRMEDKKDNETI
uniref:HTH araC/xylS-type domain-containing protein n=1 Tax=uncultured Bacillota bacterium TaxID=344338 RepID=A0A650F512_9FIRM|nr:hypothetical protein Firmicute1046_3310 [uncultured Firmicutes bacterium]